MNINIKKTFETLFGSITKIPPLLLQLNGQCIERVSSYKLLDLHVTGTVKWHEYMSSNIVLQGGTASPFPSTAQTCRNVIRRPTTSQ